MEKEEKLIYIVEDSKIIADLLNKAISNMDGVKVVDFQSGESMIARFHDIPPDLLLLDYFLDADNRQLMNGGQVLEHVRSFREDLPVIMLTGLEDQGKIQEIKQLGVEAILDKRDEDILSMVVEEVKKQTSKA